MTNLSDTQLTILGYGQQTEGNLLPLPASCQGALTRRSSAHSSPISRPHLAGNARHTGFASGRTAFLKPLSGGKGPRPKHP